MCRKYLSEKGAPEQSLGRSRTQATHNFLRRAGASRNRSKPKEASGQSAKRESRISCVGGLRGAQIGQGPSGHANAFGCDHNLLEGFNQRIQRRLGPIWKRKVK